MKPKEALVKNGNITVIKKGRLSLEHRSILEDLAAKGWDIEGFSSTAQIDKPAKADKPPKPSGVLDVPDEIRLEIEWEAFYLKDGKQKSVGMRQVCNGCHNSLVYHYCEQARVWINNKEENVQFKRRTTPLKRFY